MTLYAKMDPLNDLNYLLCQCTSILFAIIEQKINNVIVKQLYETLIGIILLIVLTGVNFVHIFLLYLINSLIILKTNKGKCHISSALFSFGYLTILRTNLIFPKIYFVSNGVFMLLTLRIVGLASEIQSLEKKINFSNIAYYFFSYLGIPLGPYFTYKTYQDHLKYGGNYINCTKFVMWTFFKSASIISLYYFIFTYFPSYHLASEKFLEKNFFYKNFYMIMIYFQFILRFWNGFNLANCSCTIVGLGVYPKVHKSKIGVGPTIDHKKLEKITNNEYDCNNKEISNKAIQSLDILNYIFHISMKTTIRSWNSTIQYWLWKNVYKNCTIKYLKMPATLAVSILWHGLTFGYFLSGTFVIIILFSDDYWLKIVGYLKKIPFGYSLIIVFKTCILSYILIPCIIQDPEVIIKFYISVYHYITIFLILMLTASIFNI